jgi:peptidyl-prolyl cis-trans isomerase SurA
VDAELEKRARATNLTAAQFTAALRQAGIDRETFEQFLLANMAWGEVVRARFRATVDVTEQDVTAALSSREPTSEEATTTAYEYRLQPIVFIVPTGAGANTEAQRRNEANAFRNAFQGCEQSLQQAAGIPGVVVKPQTRREEGQMSEAQREAFAKIEVGSATEPERIAEGFQIIAICAKNAITGQTEAAVEVRQEISSERGQLLARRYLRDLRSDAVIEYR